MKCLSYKQNILFFVSLSLSIFTNSFQTDTTPCPGSRTPNDATSTVAQQNTDTMWRCNWISRGCTRWCSALAARPYPRTTSRKFRPINTCPSTRKYKTNGILYQCTEFNVRNGFCLQLIGKLLSQFHSVYTKQLRKLDYQNDYVPIWVVP